VIAHEQVDLLFQPIIDAKTTVRDFQQTLRNNEVYYAISKGWTV